MSNLAQIERMTENFNEWESCLFTELVVGDLFRYCGGSEDYRYRKNFIFEVLKNPFAFGAEELVKVEVNSIKILDEKNYQYQIEPDFTTTIGKKSEVGNIIKIGSFYFSYYVQTSGNYSITYNEKYKGCRC